MLFDFKPAFHKRSELLDVIRAIAVILVLVFHVTTVIDPAGDPVAGWFEVYGFLGVDIFFPLSGFLITTFLLKYSGRAAIGTFFLRRFFRIVPLYMLAIGVFVLGAVVTGVDRDLVGQVWINALFLTGWYIFYEGRETVPYTITWSLSVEEFAYIVLGMSAWIARNYFIPFLWGITAFSIIVRFVLTAQGAESIYFFPPARLDSITIGALLAVWHFKGWGGRIPLILGAALIAVFVLGQMGETLRGTVLFIKLTLITCLVISVIHSYFSSFRSWMTFPFAVIGFYSYFIYLFHYFVIFGLERVLGSDMNFWVFSALTLGITTFAGYLSYALYEGPMMALGKRLEPQKSVVGHTIKVASDQPSI